jgi:hypothetical protein
MFDPKTITLDHLNSVLAQTRTAITAGNALIEQQEGRVRELCNFEASLITWIDKIDAIDKKAPSSDIPRDQTSGDEHRYCSPNTPENT